MFKVGDQVRFDCASDVVGAWSKHGDGCEKKQNFGRSEYTKTSF